MTGYWSQIKQFWLRNAPKPPGGKKYIFWSLPLLMDLGQDKQQHPAMHSGGVSSGRVRGCGCLR